MDFLVEVLSFLKETSGVWGAVLGAGVGVFSSNFLRYSGSIEAHVQDEKPVSIDFDLINGEDDDDAPEKWLVLNIETTVDFYNGQGIPASIRNLMIEIRQSGHVISQSDVMEVEIENPFLSHNKGFHVVNLPPYHTISKDLKRRVNFQTTDAISPGDEIHLTGEIPRQWKTFWKCTDFNLKMYTFKENDLRNG